MQLSYEQLQAIAEAQAKEIRIQSALIEKQEKMISFLQERVEFLEDYNSHIKEEVDTLQKLCLTQEELIKRTYPEEEWPE